MSIGIYQIKNKVNGKIYIGKSKHLEQRFNEHIKDLQNNKHSNLHLQNSWNKYGEENFELNILKTCLIEDELDNLEQYYIILLKTHDSNYGYNKTFGGDGGKFTEETRKKMSESQKGKVYSLEYKLNMSRVLKGRVLTEEWKNKISNANKGKKRSDETKKKLSIAFTGRKHSEEWKKEASERMSGENHNMAILTNDDVYNIKKLILTGMSLRKIGKMYNVNYFTIYRIKMGNSWQSVQLDFELESQLKNICSESDSSKGEDNKNSKLSEDDIREIKYRIYLGERIRDIASDFGVHRDTIYAIKNGNTWSYITIDEISNEELKNKKILRIYGTGENSSYHKLSDKDRIEIKNLIENGIKTSIIANQFNVTPTTIRNIKKRILY